ncbi:F-box/FBD/LRR-repeat protein At1g13570-like [Andrographis paniculata]|uniref:F-box/FBD/LRR-repeat protein At1g13570-like n=1 Tax=Andrographis paniculata TaxID=175694 RepID=UPI0021E86261|nr:F-box/FBD/LRR-repeat protein At1g13570-like [Andrographis paniculata]XP_051149875.1 F-box/FBD/LRR-repeat protein At1g13570-like [Andrographis paniculata]XP_051149876.1 F-box/FBD/LRR-repeat protein At1g13570-like [Andrographis paniculata]XP_051149877.1 F-box/FBD/LRR-repeat protein At1g13570-like [Andrographis paniculata]XP_051149878.1 F-box/FBD/LRR-repeat protein At1g13570-like [Andrographis paniculata]XP_051149879.1 F-box/FBD/LRR-repeat protein At1g13570-like [Andrographis paniculata]XP_05
MARGNNGVDRVSNLPFNVTYHIIGYLPLRDAVRTSTLSKGWKYKWITIPALVFDKKFKDSLRWCDLESLVDRILVLHRGPITKFSLKECYEVTRNAASTRNAAIDRWLLFLSYHHTHYIEDLSLSYYVHESVSHVIPSVLFALEHLTNLCLEGVRIELPWQFSGFGRLIKLKLSCVSMELDELITLLSKCPMLECFDFELKNSFIIGEDKESNKELNHRLNVLKLDTSFRALDNVDCVLSLLKSSPNLKSLDISCDDSIFDVEELSINCMKFADPIHLNHLESVKISFFSGSAGEMEFVRNVLQWASALKHMTLESTFWGVEIGPDFSKMVTDLAKFPRSSSAARIRFEAGWSL